MKSINIYSIDYLLSILELALNDKLKQDAQVLHGDIAQSQREITMKGFREGKFKCIICTDVLARGIDIPQVGNYYIYDPFI